MGNVDSLDSRTYTLGTVLSLGALESSLLSQDQKTADSDFENANKNACVFYACKEENNCIIVSDRKLDSRTISKPNMAENIDHQDITSKL